MEITITRLDGKAKDFNEKYQQENTVNIIAINTAIFLEDPARCSYLIDIPSCWLSLLLPIGRPINYNCYNNSHGEHIEPVFAEEPYLIKKTGKKVYKLFGLNEPFSLQPSNQHISAVLFSNHCPSMTRRIKDMLMVHNPWAKNPAPVGLIDCRECFYVNNGVHQRFQWLTESPSFDTFRDAHHYYRK